MTGLPHRILAIGAHPDDVEIYCAGTLARFRRSGAEVHVAVVCRGDRGGAVPPEPLAKERQAEARAAAAILGATPHFLGLADGEVGLEAEHSMLFLELVRRVRPDLLLTHGPTDYHDDHVRTGKLALTASWQGSNPGYETADPPLGGPVPVLYFDNLAGIAFEPTHLIDVSDFMDIKARMFDCHRTQIARSATGRHRLQDVAEAMARLRGEQCGVRHAEGFAAALEYGRRRPEPIFP